MIKAVIFDMYETLITHYHGMWPVYFGTEIAMDAKIPVEGFLRKWRGSEVERSLGIKTNEGIIEEGLRENGRYSPELQQMIVLKMRKFKEECFRHLHPGIIPMMEELKKSGLMVGLISNCYTIEAEVIRGSILYPYFDMVCLSCEEGVRKPDEKIFKRGLERLGVRAEECIYVGDGGANELAAARALGMHARQAAWYLCNEEWQPAGRMEEFQPLDDPRDLIDVAATFLSQ